MRLPLPLLPFLLPSKSSLQKSAAKKAFPTTSVVSRQQWEFVQHPSPKPRNRPPSPCHKLGESKQISMFQNERRERGDNKRKVERCSEFAVLRRVAAQRISETLPNEQQAKNVSHFQGSLAAYALGAVTACSAL